MQGLDTGQNSLLQLGVVYIVSDYEGSNLSTHEDRVTRLTEAQT